MHSQRLLLPFLVLAGAACGGARQEARAAEHPAAHAGPHWTYEGEAGPGAWGRLAPEFAACEAGKEQSPIDLRDAKGAPAGALQRTHVAVKGTVRNNGHTIQVDLEPGNTLVLDGKAYGLAQFHFHHPSEHTVDGRSIPLEVHLVHKADDGGLAVVGVMIEEGAASTVLAPVFDRMPDSPGTPVALSTGIDVAGMLPADASRFSYEGSLTTPPCSEGVRWNVMRTPVTASAAQLARFSAIFKLNNRPVQPLHARELKLSP